MAGIQGGEQADLLCGRPTSQAVDRPLAASEPSRLAIVLNQPRERLAGRPTHLLQIAADEALVRRRESQVLKLHHARLNPLIPVILGTEHRTRDGLGSRQEFFQVGKGRERVDGS